MTAWALGLLSGWIVLHLFGTDRRWPWRVADLSADVARSVVAASDPDPSDPRPSDPRLSEAHPSDLSDGASHGDVHTSVRRTRDQRTSTLNPVERTGPRRRGGPDHDVSLVRARVHDSDRPRSRAERQRRRQIETDLPVAVDLLHLAVSAGHSLHSAVQAVGGTGSGPVSQELAAAHHRFGRGSRLVDELAALPDHLGVVARPLSTTLVVAASSGTPLAPTLQRLADAERRRLRRRTEERVRRLPVLLLAPLVTLVLPAFVVLTIVPVAITTARTGLTSVTPTPDTHSFTSSPDTPSSSRSTP